MAKNSKNIQQSKENDFEFSDVLEKIKSLETINEKLIYLENVKANYLQSLSGFELVFGTPFDKKCDIEIKKLNKIAKLNIDLPTNTATPLKQIEPINFTGTTKRDLPYIFWQLQKLKLIEVDNLGLNLSKIFTYLNEPIDNTYFNAEFSKFEKGEMPTNATEIDKILLKPKKNITKLK